MWARVVEAMLGLWLLLSPFVLGHGGDSTLEWAVDLTAGTAVVVVALGSFHARLRRLHLLHLPVAGGLLVLGWLRGGPDPDAACQNWVVLALLLAMIAIVPSRAHDPPSAWQRFYAEKGRR